MGKRITGTKTSLDYKNIQEFFENRGKGKELKSKYNYVLYQDDCPGLAEKGMPGRKRKYQGCCTWKKGRGCLT